MTVIEPPAVARVRATPRACVLFALKQERKPFQVGSSHGVRVAVSGAGAANSNRAASGMLAAYEDQKPILIICGFGGALTPAMQPGDLFIADSVLDAVDGLDYAIKKRSPDPDLTKFACAQKPANVRTHHGPLVSANRVLITAREKHEWSRRTGAHAVDLETASAASVADSSGARWIAIRAITDASEQDMPLDFNNLTDPSGNVNTFKLTMATLVRPWAIPGLMRLGGASSLASKNLAAALEMILRRMPSCDEPAADGV